MNNAALPMSVETDDDQTVASRKRAQRLWDTFDQARIGIAQVALDGRLLLVNQRMCTILGYDPDTLCQMRVQDVVLADDSSGEIPWTALLDGTCQEWCVETHLFSRDGLRVWITLTISLVRDATQTPAFFIAVIEDMSARKHADDAARHSDERFRLLVSSVHEYALFTLDPEGRVTSWNEGAQRLNLYTEAEITGQHVSIFYSIEDREKGVPEQAMRRAEEQGYDETAGWRVRKDGSCFWAEVRLTAIYDAQAHVIGFGKVVDDVTEPRRIAEAIGQINTHLEQRVSERTAELATANVQLRALNQELEAFAYSVSHDLRTPLRAISGFSDILKTSYGDGLDARGRHYLDRIHLATVNMGQLIDDLLALSRLTRADIRTGPVDITALAHTAAAALQQSDPARVVTWEIMDGLLAYGDGSLLQVVLDNLLGNAWKFTSKKAAARIEVGARNEAEETVFFVRDDGAGFDMAYADKLFGAFQRLHTVREFAGTGIGLATVQRIIHRHGGRIWAHGVVDQGTTISFTLPVSTGGQYATEE